MKKNEQVFFAAIKKLKDKKFREKNKLFVVEGSRALKVFADQGWNPENIFAIELMEQEAKLLFSHKMIAVISQEAMKSLSSTKSPSGLLCFFLIPNTTTIQISNALVCANITDPGNLGTIIRSAAAFGKKQIICIEGCDPYNSKVIQASAGLIASIQIVRWSWEELLKNKNESPLCALVVSGGLVPSKLSLKNSILVIGNEAHGLPKAWIDACEQKLTLSMPGNAESLNAAVAGSIALYEQNK